MRANVWSGVAAFAFCLLLLGTALGDRDDKGGGKPFFGDMPKAPDLLEGVTFPPGSPCERLVLQADALMRRTTALDGESVGPDYWSRTGFAEFARIEAQLEQLGCGDAASPP